MGIVKELFTSRKNDQLAEADLNVIFKTFFDRLVYFSFQLLKDKDQARDIAQDAFVKYWNQRESVSANPIAIKNFLYSTVRNDSLNILRHAKVVEGYILQLDRNEQEEAPVINAIIAAEVIAELNAAVERLPDNYRLISVMGYLDGKKNQEIADKLEISINTVKKQKQRALQLLRLQLKPEMFVLLLAVFLLGF